MPVVSDASTSCSAAMRRARRAQSAGWASRSRSRQEADLALGHRVVGDHVAPPRGAEHVVVLAEVEDEVGVAGDQAGDVDGGARPAARQLLRPGAPVGGRGERRAAVPVGEPRVGGGAAHLEPPLGQAAPAGDQRLAVRRAPRPARAPASSRARAPQLADHALADHRRSPPRRARRRTRGPAERPPRAREQARAPTRVTSPPFMSRAPVAFTGRRRRRGGDRRQHGVEVADEEQDVALGVEGAGDEHRLMPPRPFGSRRTSAAGRRPRAPRRAGRRRG